MVLPLLFGLPLGFEAIHVSITKYAAFDEAKRLANGKGIINIGCGPHRSIFSQHISEKPEVLVNVDIVPDGVPNFLQQNVETDLLPFPDKYFGCAFASHVLEHLDNWQFALNEMIRVADNVVVVLPDPIYITGWTNPDHKQHFSRGEMSSLTHSYPTVVVYY